MNNLEHRTLINEKLGDINGDGLIDRIRIYGDKSLASDLIHNIIIEVEGVPEDWLKIDMITELNGYNPTLFLGDFTKDQRYDILFQLDKMFNSMKASDQGEYGVFIITFKNNNINTIFASDRYNSEYLFVVEYVDLFKVRILSKRLNKMFFLDISDKGFDYLYKYYYADGKLIKPIHGLILKAEAFIPVVSNKKENFYDLLAVHRIVGMNEIDTLGYIQNLLSWDGEDFISIQMMAITTGLKLP